jgi:nucleoside-diphosphate-sugar epimerase
VDRAGAALLAEAAQRAGVRRYLLVSAQGIDVDDPGWTPPEGTSDVFAAYLRAKAASELDLQARDLDWTVLRPGTLTNHNPTGTVRLGPPTVGRGQISRADVAAVLLALLEEPRSAGLTLDVVDGDAPIAEVAVAAGGTTRLGGHFAATVAPLTEVDEGVSTVSGAIPG